MSDTKLPEADNVMVGITTIFTRVHEGEESKILIAAGSEEELTAYLTECGHLGTSKPVYTQFIIGPALTQPEPSTIITPDQFLQN
jgi:hypothetical protein